MDERTDMRDAGFVGHEDGSRQDGNGTGTAPPDQSEYLRALKPDIENTPRTGAAAAIATAPATGEASSALAGEKRRSPRYKCEGGAQFRSEGTGDVRTWARLTEISSNGCYVEMHATSPVNTPVSLLLDVNGIRVRAQGAVRASYPVLGMGIGFTDISPEDQAKLDDLLLQLSSGAPVPAFEPLPASGNRQELLMVMDPGAALNAVAKFFETSVSLSREEFSELIGRSQQRGQKLNR